MGRTKSGRSKNQTVDDDDDDDSIEVKREESIDATLAQELDSAHVTRLKNEDSATASRSPSVNSPHLKPSRSPSTSSLARSKPEFDEVEVKPKPEGANGHVSPSKANSTRNKISRAASSKQPPPRIAPLFDQLPDVTAEATSSFQVIETSTYQNKYLGLTESALECDCNEEWSSTTRQNHACGPDSDCINRATKMECLDDCTCGSRCQNQRFTRRLYANVSVIQTDKKGYGLRVNTDLKPGDFIFEYIGEVIAEAAFRRRMVTYDQEGIKHFYFMSLSKGEFVDATKRGNLGRFCNHSCNPNCYVDKWVIGEKLRMGIFAERNIKAGEELVFNYNVDRYGANPQPCYCGESNCTGFIGGKTQTERGTKLSAATLEALGLEDDVDDWDTVVAKKPKKRKTAEDDEDYVDSAQARALDPEGVTKVMAALMQCKEKWIAVKLLQRIQSADDEMVRHRIVRLHGYRILNSQLAAWRDDENIILQILDVLNKLPRLTRNKIVDARLDQTLQNLESHNDGRVASRATVLSEAYSQLELAYRIPRKKREDVATPTKAEPNIFDRREAAPQRRRSRSRSKSPPRGPSASTNAVPSGPRAQRGPGFGPRPPPFIRGPPPLPKGWFSAQDKGRAYYYSASGQTTWARPTQPADQPPPPPKQPSGQEVLQSIINNIVTAKDREEKPPVVEELTKKEKKEERWKSYDEEKQKKLYENTLFPHISHVMNKYKHKIPKEDLKRFAKEIAKKLVASDYKAGRVTDPNKIDEKQQKKVKEFCKQFFDKAAYKHKKHEEEKATKKDKKGSAGAVETPTAMSPESQDTPAINMKKEESDDEDIDVKMSDHDEKATPDYTPSESHTLKRKRGSSSPGRIIKHEDHEGAKSPFKKLVVDANGDTADPPPPPPPPAPMETPPMSTPREDDGGEMEVDVEVEVEADLHDEGDVMFRDKSMADVKALAQAEGEEGNDGAELGEEDGVWPGV